MQPAGGGILVLFAALTVSIGAQPNAAPRPAVPADPIASILDAFRTHRVVALSEGDHGNEQGYAFRLSLIRDPRFAAAVDDIVVECGNARYQDVVDRFVRGEEIPEASLRMAWQNTVGSPGTTCDLPIYGGFLREVRAVNATRPRDRQLRVLLGDPPVDWTEIHRIEDLLPWAFVRDRHAADVVRREVLAKQRRALIVYGDAHLRRKHMGADFQIEDPITKATVDGRTLVDLLEAGGEPVFSIASSTSVDVRTLQPDVASWRMPSLAVLRATVLGKADYTSFYPDMTREPVMLPMEEKFDALLYLGPPSAITKSSLPRVLCSDAGYMETRLARLALIPGAQSQSDELKNYCRQCNRENVRRLRAPARLSAVREANVFGATRAASGRGRPSERFPAWRARRDSMGPRSRNDGSLWAKKNGTASTVPVL